MFGRAVARSHAPSVGQASAAAIETLFVGQCELDGQGVALPGHEVQLVARFGPPARGGLDIHVLGGRQRVHRKALHRGQRIAGARLNLGATRAVVGVPASAVAGRVVALDELWGDAAARRLCERLAGARDTLAAAALLEDAIAERVLHAEDPSGCHRLVIAATERLDGGNVTAVATELGVSERHLRRVFRETVGVGPKTFAKLARFHHALREARSVAQPSWASIAAAAGYYDQAHLIAEFRAISGVTPQALLGELRAARAIA